MAEKLRGNLLVGQSGGPTAVINSSLAGVIAQAAEHSEITGVYGAVHGIQGVLSEDLADLRREPAANIEALKRSPSAALGSCRHKLSDQDYQTILRVFQAHGIRYLTYIGGNDSADTSHRVARLAEESGYQLRVVGVPKTVDNDLAFTDHCPGYGSAARFNAIAAMDAGRDTEAIGVVDNVKIIETMGRNAGWIAASTALARRHQCEAPHLIYLPERPFEMESFLADVKRVFDRFGYCVVAVCEGLRDAKGELLTASSRVVDTDAFGHRQLGGVADLLCGAIAENLGIKARFDKPGTIQRMSMACASQVDLDEAYLVGRMAVRQAAAGVSGQMVTLVREPGPSYRCTTGLAPLEAVANAERPVPPEFINQEGNFVTPAFFDYAQPLVGPLPEYVRLELNRVPKLLDPAGRHFQN